MILRRRIDKAKILIHYKQISTLFFTYIDPKQKLNLKNKKLLSYSKSPVLQTPKVIIAKHWLKLKKLQTKKEV